MVHKLWYNHIKEYYSAVKINELLILDIPNNLDDSPENNSEWKKKKANANRIQTE